MENTEIKNEIMLEDAAQIIKLDGSNASFEMKNGFLTMTLKKDGEEKHYDRVFLHRAFPHELLWEYISVTGEETREIGLIYSIKDFDSEAEAILKTEIERKYYSPAIAEINSVKERYGFSYWRVKTEDGRQLSYTMQDTFRNIIHTGEDSAMLVDVDGNRYTIKSISGLDRNSYRRIELYL
jgi:hypothetical protein